MAANKAIPYYLTLNKHGASSRSTAVTQVSYLQQEKSKQQVIKKHSETVPFDTKQVG